MLTVGCHLSIAEGYAAMGRNALAIGATTFAFFTRNPRGGSQRRFDADDVAGLRAIMEGNGFGPLVAHAPYTYNLCSAKEGARAFAVEAMREDFERLEHLPGNCYNLHPGSHTGQGADRGIELICQALDEAMFDGQSTTVLLETMAGKGTEVGGRFEEIARIVEGCSRPERIGVCLDTCHVHDAGYDVVHDLDGVLREFDRTVGLDLLRAVHVNDSKNPCGSRKDRHEVIGAGYIGSEKLGGGLDAFARIVSHPALRGLPFILETPNDLPGYAREIELLRKVQHG